MPGTVTVPSGFNVGVGCPGAGLGVTTTLVIVTLVPITGVVVLPSGFTMWSLVSTLGVVTVAVPVRVKLSGVVTTVGCIGRIVIVTTPVVQFVGVAVVHTS